MLAEEIRHVADELHRAIESGTLTDLMVKTAVVQLWCLSGAAGEIERQVVPPQSRQFTGDLAPNVVLMRPRGDAA